MISTPAADTPRASPPAPTGVAFDDEGFLLEPADWTRALAERMGLRTDRALCVPLTPRL